jgi:hypothetical protein
MVRAEELQSAVQSRLLGDVVLADLAMIRFFKFIKKLSAGTVAHPVEPGGGGIGEIQKHCGGAAKLNSAPHFCSSFSLRSKVFRAA